MKVSELTGGALNWAVAKCRGFEALLEISNGLPYNPSTNWSQGGPIIERELIAVSTKWRNACAEFPNGRWEWQSSCVTEDVVAYWLDGPTPLIAAMRCYVASKFGDEIEIPNELQ